MRKKPRLRMIIAGSRSFTDKKRMYSHMKRYTYAKIITEVVSGTAKGADRLGERWADLKDIPIKRFPADWDKYGKRAGHIRNKRMAKYADEAIIFWDGESKGAKDMMECMSELNKPWCVVLLNPTKNREDGSLELDL